MRVNSIIIDDFYSNPEEVREFALQQEFFVEGNFPGHRTKSFLSDGIKETIQDILRPFAGEITKVMLLSRELITYCEIVCLTPLISTIALFGLMSPT